MKEGSLFCFVVMKSTEPGCFRLYLWKTLDKKKKCVYKNQRWEPIHQKYKANESMSRHNPKEKQKQAINEKLGKENLMQIRPKATK
jgi:hypothetical protein